MRLKFTIVGIHPVLLFVRDLLIQQGFVFTGDDEKPDFVIVGSYHSWQDPIACEVPRLVLSDGLVYSDRDISLAVRPASNMREDEALIVPPPVKPSLNLVLNCLSCENHYLTKPGKTMVLRIFDLYGDSIPHPLLSEFLSAAEARVPIQLASPGYQTTSFLHEDDFAEYFNRLLAKFISGSTGIYNVGSTESISYKRVADSVWQLVNGPEEPVQAEKSAYNDDVRWWALPDMTRTNALTKYKAKKSFRTGLWSLTRGKF